MSLVDDVKSKIDIVSFIGKYVPLKQIGKYYKACCPFHNDKTPSFVVNPETQSWRCFGACAEGGDIISFVQKRENMEFRPALELLAKQAGIEVKETRKTAEMDRLYAFLAEAADAFHQSLLKSPRAAEAREYVESRGLSNETVERWQLGYAPSGWDTLLNHLRQISFSDEDIIAVGLANQSKGKTYDRFRNRLMFPIQDERGRVIAFGARSLDGSEPKYLNSPETVLFSKSSVLYGHYQLKQAQNTTESIVVVEGYIDVLQCWQNGYLNVVAQLGTALTEQQIDLLDYETVILALDGDEAGHKAADRALKPLMATLSDIRIAQLPDGMDPDDAVRTGEWDSLIANALSLADYLIDRAEDSLPESPTLKQRYVAAKSAMPLLMRIESDTLRKGNMQKLAMRLGLPVQELMGESHTFAPQPALSIVDKPAAIKADSLELNVFSALMESEANWYMLARAFRELSIPPLEADDFPNLCHFVTTYLEGTEQMAMDVPDYVRMRHDDFPVLESNMDSHTLVQQAQLLRLRRINSETEQLIALGQYADTQALIAQRARLVSG